MNSRGLDKTFSSSTRVSRMLLLVATTLIAVTGAIVLFDCGSDDSIAVDDTVGSEFRVESVEGVQVYCRIPDAEALENRTVSIGSGSMAAITGWVRSLTIPSTVVSPNSGETYTVTVIAAKAFFNCDVLESVTIPDTVVSIGGYAFRMTALTSVTIPDSVESIDEYAFFDCSKLVEIQVDDGNPNYSSYQGVLFDKGKTRLIAVPPTATGEFIIPATVTHIARGAFTYSNYSSVSIPEGVERIDIDAFSYARQLTRLDFPATVTIIHADSFVRCQKLTSISVDDGNPNYSSDGKALLSRDGSTLYRFLDHVDGVYETPASVTAIYMNAFFESRLKTLILSDSVETIGYDILVQNTISAIYIPDSITTIVDGGFSNLYLADGTTTIGYEAAEQADALGHAFIRVDGKLTMVSDDHPSYSVTYDVNGGIGIAPEQADVMDGFAFEAKPYAGTKTGYLFTGWSFNEDVFKAGDAVVVNGGNITLVATWAPVSYTISFDANGGTGEVDDKPMTYDAASGLTANAFVRDSYSFNGWNTAADGSGTSFADGAFVSNLSTIADSTVTLYAQWTPIPYVITYNLNGGANSESNPSGYTVESAAIELADATRTGYDFLGWYSEAGFANEVESIASGSTGDVDLFAKWAPTEYTITYNLNGGANSASTPSTYTIESEDIVLAPASKTGYDFLGWYSEAGFANEVESIASGSTGDVDLFAKWVPTSYGITYNLNEGANSASNPAAYDIEDEAISFASPTRHGYDFVAWYTDEGFETPKASIPAGSTGAVTVYAKWTPTEYTIAYNLNGGANSASNPSEYTIESDAIVLASATRVGYRFDGWYSEAGFLNRVEVIAHGSTGAESLFAKWVLIQYGITYVVADGDKGSNPSNYTIESETVTFAPATRMGYVFGGWYSDAGATISKTQIASGSHGDVTVYAKWTPITYTVTFNANTGSGSMDSMAFTYDAPQNLTANAFTKAGYVFVRWATEADGTGDRYPDGSSVSNLSAVSDAEVVLYAQWTDRTYDVTFHAMGGTDAPDSVVGHGMTFDAPVTVKTGYAVAGWFTEQTYENEWDFETGAVNEDLDLYAKWIPIAYSVAFDANLGSGTMSDQTMTYDSPSNLSLSAFSRNGYSFTGWNTAADGTGTTYENGASASNLSTIADSTVRLYAQWDAIAYAITYANMDGAVNNASNPATYDIEDSAIAFAPPSRTGYTFDRWYADAGFTTEKASVSSGSTGAVTIYAKWNLIEYGITYNLNGGANSASNPSSYTVESAAIELADATRTGYEFLGWYSEAGFANEVESIASGSIGEVGLFARWSPIQYPIVYEVADGDKGANPSAYTVESGEIVFVNATRPGYAFTRWYSDENMENAVEGIGVGSMGAITVYAGWDVVEYTITYHLNGGTSNGSNPSSYTVESDAITLAPVTKTGYEFGGWYSEAGFTDRVDRIATGSTGNAELFAKWNPVAYSVVFNASGGTGEMDDQMHTYDSSLALTPNGFSRAGYTFAGWNASADGTGTSYADEASVFNLASTSGAEVTLYAQWDVVEYTITYHLNGGTSNGSNPSSYTVESGEIALSHPSKRGYYFNGWFTDEGLNTGKTAIPAGSTGNIELYAKWGVQVYSITYYLNGGTNNESNPSSYNIEGRGVWLSPATRDGYEFGGWYQQEDFSGSPVTYFPSGYGHYVRLYAKWTPVQYTISYELDGGTNGESNPASYTIEDEVASFAPATRSGYEFGGWFADEAFESAVASITVGSMGSVTMHAKWTLIEYSIEYALNGGANGENPESYTVESVAIVLEPASRAGYDFIGWFTDEEFTDGIEQIDAGSTGDLQLHAKLIPIVYGISYDLDGGTNGESNPATYTIESSAVEFAPATKDGFAFGGWFTDEGHRTSTTGVPAGSMGDVTAYARWISVQIADDSATLGAEDGGDEVSIDSEVAKTVSSKDVTIRAPSWKVEVPSGASAGLFSDADVSISISEVDASELPEAVRSTVAGKPVFSLGITKGGESFDGAFGADVKVTVKYTPSEGEDTSNIAVVCIGSDGVLGEEYKARYFIDGEQGYLEFSVPHFSYWMVTEASDDSGNGGNVVPIVIGIVAAVLVIAGAAFFLIRRKKAM